MIVFIFLDFCLIGSINSQSKMRVIDVVMSMDDDYFQPTLVAITSLLENANPKTLNQISIMIPGKFKFESKITILSLKGKYENCRVEFVDIGDRFKNISSGRFTAPAFYRLLVGSLFPELKKCIYLDSDIVVRHDLFELYDTEIEEYYVAGVCEREFKKHYTLKIPDLKHYVNSGVLVLNLENIRKNKLEEQFLELLGVWARNWRKFAKIYPDQDAINAVCYGRILCLDRKFNFYPMIKKRRADVKDPVIVHFAGPLKPWTHLNISRFHEEYWTYVKRNELFS